MSLGCIKKKFILFIISLTLGIYPCSWAENDSAQTASGPGCYLKYLQIKNYPEDVLNQKVKEYKEYKEKLRESVTDMEFVWVPGGCFNMGSNDGFAHEKPVHKVCLDGFWIGKYEVTQKEWQSIMGSNPSHFKNGDRFPVENVSWNDAKAFIKKLKDRTGKPFALPSEAQWSMQPEAEVNPRSIPEEIM